MDWETIPRNEIIDETTRALQGRGIEVVLASNAAEALEKVKEIIPAEATVMTGASTTLDQIGFTDYLISEKHPYRNLKDAILAEKDPAKQGDLRRQSILADYYLGSVQAITREGPAVSVDASGTRTGPYSFGPKKVIWVVSANKIVANLDEAMRRVREHCVPLEDKRMKSAGYPRHYPEQGLDFGEGDLSPAHHRNPGEGEAGVLGREEGGYGPEKRRTHPEHSRPGGADVPGLSLPAPLPLAGGGNNYAPDAGFGSTAYPGRAAVERYRGQR